MKIVLKTAMKIVLKNQSGENKMHLNTKPNTNFFELDFSR